MLRSLKIWQRLLVLAVFFSIPIVMLLSFLVSEQSNAIVFSVKEQEGVLYLKPTRNLLSSLLTQRDTHIALISGDSTLKPKIEQLQLDVDAALAALQEVGKSLPSYEKSNKQIEEIVKEWGQLKQKLPATSSLSAEQSFESHNRTIRAVMRFLVIMGNESNLILDPDVDSYYCMDAVIFKLPKLNDDISKARARGANTLLLNLATDTARKEQLRVLVTTIEESQALQGNNIEYGLLANQDLDGKLRGLVELAGASTTSLTTEISNKLINSETPQMTAANLTELSTKAFDDNFRLYDTSLTALDGLLRARVEGFQSKRLLTLVLSLGSVLVAFAVLFLSARSITAPIRELSSMAEKISLGELKEEIKSSGKDELTELSEKFRRMQTSLKAAMEHINTNDPL